MFPYISFFVASSIYDFVALILLHLVKLINDRCNNLVSLWLNCSLNRVNL